MEGLHPWQRAPLFPGGKLFRNPSEQICLMLSLEAPAFGLHFLHKTALLSIAKAGVVFAFSRTMRDQHVKHVYPERLMRSLFSPTHPPNAEGLHPWQCAPLFSGGKLFRNPPEQICSMPSLGAPAFGLQFLHKTVLLSIAKTGVVFAFSRTVRDQHPLTDHQGKAARPS